MINGTTLVSGIGKYAPTTLTAALPGICMGGDLDDAWLSHKGLARVSSPSDYDVNPSTQTVTALAQPTYNAATNLWDAYVVTPIPLADAAARKCAEVDNLLSTKIFAGAHWNNILFQIDPGSETKFAGAGAYALGVVNNAPGALPWPENFFWIAADNSHVVMTAAQCFAFTQTMGQAITALVLGARLIKDACLAAPDFAALNAIDITKNWPSV